MREFALMKWLVFGLCIVYVLYICSGAHYVGEVSKVSAEDCPDKFVVVVAGGFCKSVVWCELPRIVWSSISVRGPACCMVMSHCLYEHSLFMYF